MIDPLRPLVNWTQRDVASFVADPRRARSVYWRMVLQAIVYLSATLYIARHLDDGPWSSLAAVLVSVLFMRAALMTFTRANAYKFGWLDGRREMIGSLREAISRDMTLQEWAEAQFEKDWRLLTEE